MKIEINKSIKYKTGSVIVYSLVSILLSSCGDKDHAEPDTQTAGCNSAKFAIITTTGAWPSQTSYLQSLTNMNISSLNNGSATEIPASSCIWKYNGSIYSSSFGSPATLVKYTWDENCNAVASKKMMVVGANTFSSIEFISSSKGYASVGGGLAKLVEFNPSSMQITGEVDLSSIQKAGSPNVYYVGSAVRDSLMFLAVYYSDVHYKEFSDSCFVAVINTNANKVIKLISDGRTGMILGNGSLGNVFAKDDNGDIYIQGMGYSFKGNKTPSGILRIRNGTTEFDHSYFLNLEAVTGKDCYSINLFHGKAFTWRVENPADFWCFNGSNFKLYKLDLYTKTLLGEVSSSIPMSKASKSCPMLLENNNVYFSIAGDLENAMWVYDLSNGSVSKKFTMTGQCNGIQKFE